jgi:hypothetical protein
MTKWTTDVARDSNGAGWIATFSNDAADMVTGTGPTPAAALEDAATKTTDESLLSAIESARAAAGAL